MLLPPLFLDVQVDGLGLVSKDLVNLFNVIFMSLDILYLSLHREGAAGHLVNLVGLGVLVPVLRERVVVRLLVLLALQLQALLLFLLLQHLNLGVDLDWGADAASVDRALLILIEFLVVLLGELAAGAGRVHDLVVAHASFLDSSLGGLPAEARLVLPSLLYHLLLSRLYATSGVEAVG